MPAGALEVHAVGLDGAAPWLADLAAGLLSGLDGVTATHDDPPPARPPLTAGAPRSLRVDGSAGPQGSTSPERYSLVVDAGG